MDFCRYALLLLLLLVAVAPFFFLLSGNSALFTRNVLFGVKTAEIPIYMVEQHGEVMKHWLDEIALLHSKLKLHPTDPTETLENRPTVNLLHIDSHSDIMDVRDLNVDERGLPSYSKILAAVNEQEPDIGDFITRAGYQGHLYHTAWLRSDFSIGGYNDPPVGDYNVNFGFRNHSKISSHGEDDGDMICMQVIGSAANVDVVNDRVDDGVCGDTEFPVSGYLSAATIDTVKSLRNFTSNFFSKYPEEASLGGLSKQNRPWILDIDLDYFATNDPVLACFAQFGFSFDWALEYVWKVFRCRDMEDSSDFQKSMRALLMPKMAKLLTNANSVNSYVFKRFGVPCSVHNLTQLKLLVGNITISSERKKNWTDMWIYSDADDQSPFSMGDMVESFFSDSGDLSPVGEPSEEEITESFGKVQSLLSVLVAKAGNPLLITIARSERFDNYLPSKLAPFIQNSTVRMLTRLFPKQLGHMQYHDEVLEKDRGVYY